MKFFLLSLHGAAAINVQFRSWLWHACVLVAGPVTKDELWPQPMWLMLWAIIVDNNISVCDNSHSNKNNSSTNNPEAATTASYFVLRLASVSGFWL